MVLGNLHTIELCLPQRCSSCSTFAQYTQIINQIHSSGLAGPHGSFKHENSYCFDLIPRRRPDAVQLKRPTR
jgi:hypothetical protein